MWNEGVIPTLYHYEGGFIAITGVGLHHAMATFAKHASLCDEVINIGLAGTLKNGREIGTLLPIHKVGKYIPLSEEERNPTLNECLEKTVPTIILKEGEGDHLVSSDFPIHLEKHRQRLSPHYDLVDMEGYSIAHLAKQLGKKCSIWKIVSDFASPGGRELIRKHKSQLSKQIARHLIDESYCTT
ncbi:MAG: hypothetical protein S4CHLAM45_13680 [Chlamydiales bacterium]|nr:hypothetical protein [Chlamydiales bacterium]MCH9620472.1 hypothetical protein [Chlamydiales bacterium]MCH9623458.1 hypothetical protein [Chlamydiales bacterium]